MCPLVIIINLTFVWNLRDEQALVYAKDRCKVLYGQEAPCLKQFHKRRPQGYWAVCGK